jgi:DNA-binding transcriptional regulator YiaG
MPNLATTLKTEIARISKRALRSETESLKKSVATYRSDIAGLKRRTQALEQQVRRLLKGMPTKPALVAPAAEDASGVKTRFSAKSLKSQRRRLGLSAAELALLVGTTGQSIFNWEAGTARPRDRFMPAIAALRSLGKKDAAAVVQSRMGR